MTRNIVRMAVAMALMAAGTSAFSYVSQQEAVNFEKAVDFANAGQWEEAYELAAEVRDPVAAEIIEWLHLRKGVSDWDAYRLFLARGDDWPGLRILRRSGEKALTGNENPYHVIQFFESYDPQTGNGALRYARALQALGKPDMANRVIRDAFLSLPFTNEDLDRVIHDHPLSTVPLLAARMDNLIGLNRIEAALQLKEYLSGSQSALLAARTALKANRQRVNDLIRAVPDDLRGSEGITHDRVSWRLRNDEIERGIDLFLEYSEADGALGKPVFWSTRRLRLAHSLMREGRNEEAYRLASSHQLTRNGVLKPIRWLSSAHRKTWANTQRSNYLELEWLAGFIALRKLDHPERALAHFHNYYLEVQKPSVPDVSHSAVRSGKAGYWLGVTYEAIGNSGDALTSYRFGARFQTSFYGQLATQRINAPTSQQITRREPLNPELVKSLKNDKIVRAGLIFSDAELELFAGWFLSHRAESLDRSGIAALASIARANGSEYSALKVAKQGARQGDVIVEYLFPLTAEARLEYKVSPAMAISVIRQESEFRLNAVSHKGAMGLMQVMPSTGKPIAEDSGIYWSTKDVLFDRNHNMMIGTTYLKELLDSYGNSQELTFAAYNAGPNRVKGWLPKIGDPRSSHIGLVDWIEHIPYEETRNYVMRVAEALTIYQVKLEGRPIAD